MPSLAPIEARNRLEKSIDFACTLNVQIISANQGCSDTSSDSRGVLP
jgi:hypothetical protein